MINSEFECPRIDKLFAEANLFAEIGDDPLTAFHALAQSPDDIFGSPQVQISRERFQELIDSLCAVTEAPSLGALLELLQSTDVKRQVWELACAEEGVRRKMYRDVRDGLQPIGVSDYLGTSDAGRFWAVGGIVSTFAGIFMLKRRHDQLRATPITRREFLKLSGVEGVLAGMGLGSDLFPPINAAMVGTGASPAGDSYVGPTLPFLLHFGTSSPNRRQIELMVAHLRERLSEF